MVMCFKFLITVFVTLYSSSVRSIYQDKHQTAFYSNLLNSIYSSDLERQVLPKYSPYTNPLFSYKTLAWYCSAERQPQNQVIFMKVHKAGSTTAMNIFLRYGDSNNLNIVLPRSSRMEFFNYLGFESTVDKRRIMKIPKNEIFHIFCNHAIYNKDAFEEVMGTNTVKIAILREPVAQWTSAALYFGYIDYFRNIFGDNLSDNELLSAFLEDPEMYSPCPHTHNAMFEDLGLPPSDFNNFTAVENYLRFLDEHVSLVILMEYFEESLVLMKRILCWDIKDILYVPLNKNKKRSQMELTKKDKRSLAQFNYADFKLYVHFKDKLFRQIKESGNNFFDEVEYFKYVKKKMITFCQASKLTNFTDGRLTIKRSSYSADFIMTSDDCKFMMSDEDTLLIRLMKKARKKYFKL